MRHNVIISNQAARKSKDLPLVKTGFREGQTFRESKSVLEIIHYPLSGKGNPYHLEMTDALRRCDVDVVAVSGGLLGLLWRALRSDIPILHLHWIGGIANNPSLCTTMARVGLFYAALLVWRIRGKPIIWTVHNLSAHESRRPRLDRWNSALVAALSVRVLVHGFSAVPVVEKEFGVAPGKMRVIYHGNYRQVVRPQDLRIDHEGRRFLFFGTIRPYKGIPELLAAFQRLDGPHELRVVGRVGKHPGLAARIEEQAKADKRVSVVLRFLSDEELEEQLGWCDVVVLAYRDILTSGSLLMALTAGRPVVIPKAGLLPEYACAGCAFFYDRSANDGLLDALRDAAWCQDLPEKALAARRRADDFDWNGIAPELATLYREVLEG